MVLPVLGKRKLKFECTRCGACCKRAGVVYLKPGEVGRLAKHLGLSAADFRARFVTPLPDGRPVIQVPEGRGCPLLDGDLCSVDPVKPDQCRAYPFWEELVDDPGAWADERAECEGIGRGKPWDPAEVQRLVRLDPGPDGPPLKPRRRRA